MKEIVDDSENIFGYVSSKENPANMATRGTSVQKLVKNELWWYGPPWLRRSQNERPGSVYSDNENADFDYNSEIKKLKSVKETGLLNSTDTVHDSATYHSGESTPLGIECERYSSITKL